MEGIDFQHFILLVFTAFCIHPKPEKKTHNFHDHFDFILMHATDFGTRVTQRHYALGLLSLSIFQA